MNKIKTWTLLVVVFITLIQQSYAFVRTKESPEWNKDSLTAYFKKYKLQIDQNSDYNSLVETIKSYKDAVTANSRLFGTNVEHILSGFKHYLEKQAKLTENDTNDLFTHLKHQLRQLELKGQLTKDRVQAVLDKAHYRVMHEKLMTESEWKKAYAHFESTYTKPSWYQRLFHLKPDPQDIETSSLRDWVQSATAHLSTLTKDQVSAVSETLYESILNSDLNKLGERAWAEELAHTISQRTQIKKEQLEEIVQSIANQVRAYKIFAIDYSGQAKEQAHHWMGDLQRLFWNKVEGIMEPIKTRLPQRKDEWHFYNYRDRHLKYPGQEKKLTASLRAQAKSMSRAAEPKTNVVSYVIETAVSVASDAAAQATDSVKGSFAHFWSQREYEIYRRLGYTEAHVDWIKNYLEQTFQNQKDSVKGKSDEAAIAIKRYLDSCKIQTPNQVDANVHRMKRYLDSWSLL